MKSICPKSGHLVRVRDKSALALDIVNSPQDPWHKGGLIIDELGIEVHVLLTPGVFSWVRRDNLEVVQ